MKIFEVLNVKTDKILNRVQVLRVRLFKSWTTGFDEVLGDLIETAKNGLTG